jgi:hypothetical protein
MTEMHINLKVDDPGGEPVFERLRVEQIDHNRFKLLNSPGLVEGLAAGDEVELGESTGGLFRVVKRGGNLNVWLFFEGGIPNEKLGALSEAVESIGGYLDGGTHRSLIFTIPANVGFPRVENAMDRLTAEYPGASWMFANVYDATDGVTPLNWWKE